MARAAPRRRCRVIPTNIERSDPMTNLDQSRASRREDDWFDAMRGYASRASDTTTGWLSEAGTGNGLAMLGAGILIGMALARFAAPPAARAVGSLRAMAGRDPFEALAADHRAVLALMDRMIEAGPDARLRRGAMLFQLKRMLTAHALAEEDVVYPMLRDDAGRVETAMGFYREHAEMKVRLFELEHLTVDDPRWTAGLRELRDIVAGHARAEEEEEFPRLRSAIGDARQGELLGDLSREKAMIV
jgi:hemerythrin superfamily protein